MDVVRPDHTRIYAFAEGVGAPVVFTHGLFCDHRLFAEPAKALLAHGYSVVRWDLRGHGRSTRGPTPNFDTLVEDLAAVLDYFGLESVALVGHDQGAAISLAFALQYPDRVSALALWSFDAAPMPPSHQLHTAVIAAARQVSIRPFTYMLEPLWVRRFGEGHDDAQALLHRRTATTLSPGALGELLDALVHRPDLRPLARELPMPVWVGWGDHDRLIRPMAGREMLHAIPHAEGGPLVDAAHLLSLDQPQVVSDALLAFLRR